jgi:hypothetical protein
MTLVAITERVTEIGKVQNKVGGLHIPTTDVKLSNGLLLRLQSIEPQIPDSGKYQVLRDGDYVNLMTHCFQMWQAPEKWGVQ